MVLVLVLLPGGPLVLGGPGGLLVVLLLLLAVLRVAALAPAAATATTAATAGGPVPVLVGLVTLVLGVRAGLRLGLGRLLVLLGGEGDRGRGGLGLDGLTATAAATARTALRRRLGLLRGRGGLGGLLGGGLLSAARARRPLLGLLVLVRVALVVRGRGTRRGRGGAAVSGVWNIGSAKTGAWKTATAGRAARRPLRTGSSALAVNSGRPAGAVARRR